MLSMQNVRPVSDASAWVPADLETDRGWDVTLEGEHKKDLLAATEAVRDKSIPLGLIDRGVFPLPKCEAVVARIRHQLQDGRGFALLHGFPIENLAHEDIERMYWGFCAHLGIGVTQNGDGTLIHCVTEGRLRPSQGTRSVGNPGKVAMHVDLADVVSLLCVRQAVDSPHSRLSSSMTLYNRLLAEAPEGMARLLEGFPWDRQNEHGDGETPTTGYRVPVFSEAGGKISCRYNRNWIRKARERAGRGFDAEETRLLDLMDRINDEIAFEFPFQPGDVQFANNYTTLHGRAPHTPAASEESTRLLMRIWVNMDGLRPVFDEPILRYGVLCHGKLGWTGPDAEAGLDGKRHPRRAADAAPLGTAA